MRSGAKYPPPNHMYTFLTAIFISEGRVSPEVKKEAQRFRYFKNYLASIRGYSETVTPTVVFATGISKMLGSIPGLAGTENVAYTLLVVTLTSLVFTLQSNILAISAGGAGLAWCYVRVILAALLIILAIILAVDSIRTMAKQKKLA